MLCMLLSEGVPKACCGRGVCLAEQGLGNGCECKSPSSTCHTQASSKPQCDLSKAEASRIARTVVGRPVSIRIRDLLDLLQFELTCLHSRQWKIPEILGTPELIARVVATTNYPDTQEDNAASVRCANGPDQSTRSNTRAARLEQRVEPSRLRGAIRTFTLTNVRNNSWRSSDMDPRMLQCLCTRPEVREGQRAKRVLLVLLRASKYKTMSVRTAGPEPTRLGMSGMAAEDRFQHT